jgi:hypothetical protein
MVKIHFTTILENASYNYSKLLNFTEIEKIVCRFFDISAKNLLASGVAFGNKAGKLLILTDECKMWLLFVL